MWVLGLCGLTPLVGCSFGLDGLERRMRAVGAEVKLPVREDDVFSMQWDRWRGERREQTRFYRDTVSVKPQKLPSKPDEIIAFAREGLAAMAAGEDG
ncbi:hypothetical protein FHR32_007188 [Streptosporangium album]|uniref:Uncharacterized protein n=1 Tax=Streptosporangium album TaxID=47479 RepID=A0A7W7S3Y3_9ACTN|nr:hypothetical protein [Streptosporangium album]MBB4942788.1 hypothetical protein [Streptosporangium album]